MPLEKYLLFSGGTPKPTELGSDSSAYIAQHL